jgi:hypothetical protein
MLRDRPPPNSLEEDRDLGMVAGESAAETSPENISRLLTTPGFAAKSGRTLNSLV